MIKIKDLIKEDRYTFTLDNKQIASIILSSLALGIILFLIGYFIGFNKGKKITLNQEKKNVAIIKTVPINAQDEEPKDNDSESDKLDDKNQEIQQQKENELSEKENVAQKDTEKNIENKNNDSEKPKEDKKSQKAFKTKLKSASTGDYMLQVLATPDIDEANTLKDKLIQSGYNVFIEETKSNDVIYNRVRIGFFANENKAKEFKAKFEKETEIKKTFVIKK